MGKDKQSCFDKRNIVYKIDCIDCDATYIGQISRKLRFRVDEHKRDVRKKKSTSALAKHTLQTGHTINFDRPKMMDTEVSYKKNVFLRWWISIITRITYISN